MLLEDFKTYLPKISYDKIRKPKGVLKIYPSIYRSHEKKSFFNFIGHLKTSWKRSTNK